MPPSYARLSKRFFILIFTSVLSINVTAQQPGGVTGTKAWFVASPNGQSLVDIAASRVRYDAKFTGNGRTFNFHPAILLSSSNVIELKNVAFNQGTVAGMYYPAQTVSSDQFFRVTYDPYAKVTNNYLLKNASLQTPRGRYAYGSTASRTTLEVLHPTSSATAMKTAVFHSATARNYLSVWGEDKKTTLEVSFRGYLPEMILYNRALSPLEIVRVQTYLAIKYGTTLDTSYIIRNGTTIWDIRDPTINKFHHRVCAIAKDSLAALHQFQSNTSYEDGYLAYNKSSSFTAGDFYPPNDQMIPQSDSPSLYRTLTIGFTDCKTVAEGTYLIWGDNGVSFPASPLPYLDAQKKIETIGRVWMLKNPSRTTAKIKMVLAGKAYFWAKPQNGETLFERIYNAYDYQFYRYLLIRLGSPNITDTLSFTLNSYFGREQEKRPKAQNFNTRFIVWDSISLDPASPLNYFTFGRVPLLSFWEVGKLKGNAYEKKLLLKYAYDRNKPLLPQTIFDTVLTGFKDNDSIQLKLSLGVNPVTVRYKENKPGALWKDVNDTINIDDLAEEPPVINPPLPAAPATPAKDSSSEQSEETAKGDIRYITKQAWKKGLPYEYFKLRGLKTNTSYTIEATDRLGQRSSLILTTKSAIH